MSTNEFFTKRIFDAPRARVFQAWSDPQQLARWWGPNGFKNTFNTFEFRAGGAWSFVMHGPDGQDYKNESAFVEIVHGERIVLDHLNGPQFRATFVFVDKGHRTEVQWTMKLASDALYENLKGFIPQANEQNLDRLEALLAAEPDSRGSAGDADRELVLTRDIAAPRERIFKAWTTQLGEWWGPHGMTTPYVEMDLRPGGIFRTIMRAPDGTEYPTKGIFLDVVENERLVFTDAFDAQWQPSPDLFFTAIITLEELPGGKTRYTARARHWTKEACAKHAAMGFHQGWGESLDRLVALVC